MKYYASLIFLFSILTNSFSQQDAVVLEEHEYIAIMGVGMDFNQYTAGLGYYYNLDAERQIGTGIEINLLDGEYNVTNRSFQEEYLTTNLSHFEELQPSRAFYLDIPLVYAFQLQMANSKFKIEGGVTNKFFLAANGFINTRLQEENFSNNVGGRSQNSPASWIAPHGFRKYGLNTNTSISYFLKTGMGFKLQIGIPVIKLGQPVDKIPSGESLFKNNKQPTTIMFYFLCKFNKKYKKR